MAPRRSRWAIALIAVLLVVSALIGGAWAWITAWAPVRGKAWLQAQLQRQLNQDVSIGAVRVAIWQGLLLRDVIVRDRVNHAVWLDAEQLRVRINPLSLVHQRVAFRLGGALRVPCRGDISVAGRYNLQDRQLAVDLVTSDVPIARISPPFAQYVPKEVREGILQLTATMRRAGDEPISISGRVMGRDLVWQRDQLRITGRLTLDGQAVATPQGPSPWLFDATAVIDDAIAEGVPVFERTDHIGGTLRWQGRGIDIQELHGDVFASRWQLEGHLEPWPATTMELLLRTPIDVAKAASGFPALRLWQPTGSARLTAMCRGPLARWPNLELMLDAELLDATLQPPVIAQPLTAIRGRIRYDHLTKQLTVDSLSARLQNDPIALRGTARLIQPAELHLQLETKTDLARAQPWLPDNGPRIRGPASLRLAVTGTSAAPIWEGDLTLENATFAWPAISIDQLRGMIQFDREQLGTTQLLMVIAGEPVRLSGTVKEFLRQPNVALTAQFPRGSLAINAKAWEDRVQLERLDAAVGSSRVQAHGTIARPPHTESRLSLGGVIDTEDLTSLPWVKWPALAQWQLSGSAEVHATLEGELPGRDSWLARGTINSDRLVIRGLAVHELQMELDQHREQLTLRVANSIVAGGRLTGSLTIVNNSAGPDVALDADFVRADLAQLAAAIPAWKSLGISGDVSTRATISGTWPRQDTYQGQGWIHATGDRLGELPLLDRVLRGSLGAIGDRLGLSTLRKAQLMEIAGQWQLARGRIATEDLRLNGNTANEPITIYVRGSVGLDKTLDLTIDPELSEQVVLDSPTTRTLASTILRSVGMLDRVRRLIGRHHIGGTIDKPDPTFQFGMDELFSQAIPFGLDQLLNRRSTPPPGTR